MSQFQEPVVINGFIYASKYDWEDCYSFSFSVSDKLEDSGYLMIAPHTIVQPIPVTFDPVAAELIALQKSKTKAVEAFQKEMTRHNERISKLLALSAPKTENGMEVLDAVEGEGLGYRVPGSVDDIPF